MNLVTFYGVLVTAICLSQITDCHAANMNGRYRTGIKEKRQSGGAVAGGYASSSLNPGLTPVYTAPRSRGDGDETGNEVDATTTIVYEDEVDREEEGTSEDYQYVPGTTQNPGEEEAEEKSGGGYGPSVSDEKMSSGQGGYGSSASQEKISGGYGGGSTSGTSTESQSREQQSSGGGGYDYTPSRQAQQGGEEKKADDMESSGGSKTSNPNSQPIQQRPMDQQQIENFSRQMSVQPPSRAYQLPSVQGSVGNYRAYYGAPAYLANSLSEEVKSSSGGYGSSSPAMQQEYFPVQPFRSNGDSPMFGGRQETLGFSTSSSKPTTFYGSPNEIIPQPTSYLPPSSNAYQSIQAVEYRPESRANQGAPQRFSQQQQDGGKPHSNSGVGYYLPPQQSYTSERPQEARQPQAYNTPPASQPQPQPTYQSIPSSTTAFYSSNDNSIPQNQYPDQLQPQQQQQQSQFQPQSPESRTSSDNGNQQNSPTTNVDNRNLQSAAPASPSGPPRTGGFQLDFDEFHDNDNVVDAELIQRVQQIIEEHERQQKELKANLRREYEASEAGFFGNSRVNNPKNQQQYGPPQAQQQQQYGPPQSQQQQYTAPQPTPQQYGPPQQSQQQQYAAPQQAQQQQYAAPQHPQQQQYAAPAPQQAQQQYPAPQQEQQQQQYGPPQQIQPQAQQYASPASQPQQQYSASPAQSSNPQSEYGPPSARNDGNPQSSSSDYPQSGQGSPQPTAYSGPVQERDNYYSEPNGNRNLDSTKEQSILRSDSKHQNNVQSENQAQLPDNSQAQAQQGSGRQGGSKRLGNIEYQKAILTDHFVETQPGPYNPGSRSSEQYSAPQSYSPDQGQSSSRFPPQSSLPEESSQFIRTQQEPKPQAPAQVSYSSPGSAYPPSGNNYFLPGGPNRQTEVTEGRAQDEAADLGNRNGQQSKEVADEQSRSPLPVYGPVSFQSRGNVDVPDFSSLGQFISPEQAQQILASSNGQFNNPQEQSGYPQSLESFPPTGNTRTIILHQLPAYAPLPSSSSPLSNNILINPSEFAGNSREIPSGQYGSPAPASGPSSAPSPTTGPADTSSPPPTGYSRTRGEQAGRSSESPFPPQPQSYNQQPEGFISSAYGVQPRESDGTSASGEERQTELQIGYLFPQTSSFIPQTAYGIESLNLNEIPVSSPKPIYGIPLAPVLGLESFSPSSSQAVAFGQEQHQPDNFPPPPQSPPQQYEQNQISTRSQSQYQYQPLPTSYGIPFPQQYTFSPALQQQVDQQRQQLSPASSYPGSHAQGDGQILSWESQPQSSAFHQQPSNQDNIEPELSSHSITPISQIYGLRTSPNNNNNPQPQQRYPSSLSSSSQPKLQSNAEPQQSQGGYSSRYPRRSRRIVRKNVSRRSTTTTTTARTA